jgi:hypothetical protein
MEASGAKLPIFDLPTEIRQMVWKCILTTNLIICLQKSPGWYDLDKFVIAHNPQFSLSSQLLRTNHHVYAETRPILYGSNTF